MRGILIAAVALVVLGCSGAATSTPAPTQVVDQATPEPTLDLGTVEGLGVITFGTDYDEETLLITKPKTEFKKSVKNIAWSAQLSEAAGALTLRIVLARVSKGGAETIIDSADVEISSPEFSLIANKANLALVADNKAGTYVLRYLRDSTILAEGQFKLTK